MCGCVGKVPSQAKYSRQGSFTECVSVWGRCHLRPNTPDRGLFCVVPSQAKHSRQGSFFVSVAAWGMNHLRPNISDRGLLLSVCQCGEGVISSQTCQTGVFLRCTISGQTFQTGVFFSKCGCVGNEPSQAKHSRQGSFTECVSVWGRCHLRPNIPDRGLFF